MYVQKIIDLLQVQTAHCMRYEVQHRNDKNKHKNYTLAGWVQTRHLLDCSQ